MGAREQFVSESLPLSSEFSEKNPGKNYIEARDYAYKIIFNSWVKKRKFDELTDAILSEFDGQKSEYWMMRLSDILAANDEKNNFEKVFTAYFSKLEKLFAAAVDLFKSDDPEISSFKPTSEKIEEHRLNLLRILALFHKTATTVKSAEAVAVIDKKICYYEDWNPGFKISKSPPVKITPAPFGRREFWFLIESAKERAKGTLGVMLALEKILRKMPAESVFKVGRIFYKLHSDLYRQNIWDVIYIVKGGCGDDAFDAFRSWVVLRGKADYFKIKKDPVSFFEADGICKNLDIEEGLFSMIDEVYEDLSGRDAREIYANTNCELAEEIVTKP